MYFKDCPFLSNFHPCEIQYGGIIYPSVENAYQAQKCPERAEEFVNISARDAKNLGKLMFVRTGKMSSYELCGIWFNKSLQIVIYV